MTGEEALVILFGRGWTRVMTRKKKVDLSGLMGLCVFDLGFGLMGWDWSLCGLGFLELDQNDLPGPLKRMCRLRGQCSSTTSWVAQALVKTAAGLLVTEWRTASEGLSTEEWEDKLVEWGAVTAEQH